MHFYGLYKLLPKLVQFWSAKWMQALSGTSYSIFFSPLCLLTSFSTPLCTLSFASASPSSQNKCVFNVSTLKIHTKSACLCCYHLFLLLPLICKHAESAVYSVLGCLLHATGVARAKFSIDFSWNKLWSLHPFLSLPDLLNVGHKFNCYLWAQIHKSLSDPDLSTSVQTENTNWCLLGNTPVSSSWLRQVSSPPPTSSLYCAFLNHCEESHLPRHFST